MTSVALGTVRSKKCKTASITKTYDEFDRSREALKFAFLNLYLHNKSYRLTYLELCLNFKNTYLDELITVLVKFVLI